MESGPNQQRLVYSQQGNGNRMTDLPPPHLGEPMGPRSAKRHVHLFRKPSVTRITLNQELQRQFERLRRHGAGVLLDVGAKQAPYKERIAATTYMTLDIDESRSPDICCDLHNVQWPSEYFDTIVA